VLVEYFVQRFARTDAYRRKVFTDEALAHLRTFPWRGNVRELKNLVERLLILSPSDRVTRDDVMAIGGAQQAELSAALLGASTLRELREMAEKLYLQHKLAQHGWNVTQTAQAIDTPRSNLYKKMEQYAIRRGGEGTADEEQQDDPAAD
jgi:two-component system nitrogen regulation response regulator NtrX